MRTGNRWMLAVRDFAEQLPLSSSSLSFPTPSSRSSFPISGPKVAAFSDCLYNPGWILSLSDQLRPCWIDMKVVFPCAYALCQSFYFYAYLIKSLKPVLVSISHSLLFTYGPLDYSVDRHGISNCLCLWRVSMAIGHSEKRLTDSLQVCNQRLSPGAVFTYRDPVLRAERVYLNSIPAGLPCPFWVWA